MTLHSDYDIVILGGGPAGLAAATTILQQLDVSVLIVEAQTPEQERIGESCPPDTILLLQQLGLTKAFHQGGHAPCPGYASVWGRAKVGYNDFIVNPLGPGWRLNRRLFDQMLAQKAVSHGAQLEYNLRFSNAHMATGNQPGYQLRLINTITRSTHEVKARFVIDATGAKARFARAIGISKKIGDQLYALVRFADINAGQITKQVLLEATAYGWWYSAALPGNRLVSMVVTEKETLPALQLPDKQGFEKALQTTTFLNVTLEKLSLANKQYYTWPIYSGMLNQVEGKDWMAIGDAASSFDPISSQGIHKALTDGTISGKKVISIFNDHPDKSASFSDHVEKRYTIYKEQRAYVYSLEQRWTDAPFWVNRRNKT